ncbi:MAG: DUF5060 domain-containing protein, partial [Nitrosopumilaceae archaeon]|nr:DUF5060 domain-containing protein [Nitrosopumilaceae archaeon]NIX62131.1 DUF5060 domain-containing protein [Nitrosopumilaceae archaeon]
MGLYEVLELNFHYSGIFRNPWEYADIVVEFIHPKSRDTLTVGGFYYQFDEWKVRFSPAKIGIWSYNYQFSVHGKSIAEGRGRFTANPSGHPGYVRISPENSYRFVYDNGKPYYPLGFGNCNYDNTFGFDG